MISYVTITNIDTNINHRNGTVVGSGIILADMLLHGNGSSPKMPSMLCC